MKNLILLTALLTCLIFSNNAWAQNEGEPEWPINLPTNMAIITTSEFPSGGYYTITDPSGTREVKSLFSSEGSFSQKKMHDYAHRNSLILAKEIERLERSGFKLQAISGYGQGTRYYFIRQKEVEIVAPKPLPPSNKPANPNDF